MGWREIEQLLLTWNSNCEHINSVCFCVIPGKDEPPNMGKLLDFNVHKGVGTEYHMFGIWLLNDMDGNEVNVIVHDQKHAHEINIAILIDWVNGKGIDPTWDNLIDVLWKCKLTALAQKIQSARTDNDFDVFLFVP